MRSDSERYSGSGDTIAPESSRDVQRVKPEFGNFNAVGLQVVLDSTDDNGRFALFIDSNINIYIYICVYVGACCNYINAQCDKETTNNQSQQHIT